MKQHDLYAVMGNPIAHSLSPTLHQAFAAQTHQALAFEKILVAPTALKTAILTFVNRGGKGLSITLPFKQEAFLLMDAVDEAAQTAQAINNIIISKEKKLFGVNTDGLGLVKDIQMNLNIPLKNQFIVLMGAGGAVRGVLPALLKEKPRQILLVNRTVEKAKALAEEFSTLGSVCACTYEDLNIPAKSIIINGTSASITHTALPLPEKIDSPQLCYDMMYGDSNNPFLTWARHQNALRIADGIGMLIEQGAAIFALWRSTLPDTKPLLKQYRGIDF